MTNSVEWLGACGRAASRPAPARAERGDSGRVRGPAATCSPFAMSSRYHRPPSELVFNGAVRRPHQFEKGYATVERGIRRVQGFDSQLENVGIFAPENLFCVRTVSDTPSNPGQTR